MERVKTLKLRVMPSSSIEDSCKELAAELSIVASTCAESEPLSKCRGIVRRKARSMIGSIIEMGPQALEARECKGIASRANMA